MNTLPIRILITLCWLQLMSGYAPACDCARSPTIQELVGGSSAVFSGRVVNVSPTENVVHVTMEVAQVWKGNIAQTTQVDDNTTDCAVGFEMGKDYLVYASYGEDINGDASSELSTGGECGGTRELLTAQRDLKVLGESYNPLPNPVNTGPLRWGLALFPLCGITAILWFSRKRFISSS